MEYSMLRFIVIILISFLLISCSNNKSASSQIGRFQTERDLLLLNFDCKTDVDDLHSVAGVFTILSNPLFSEVNYYAVSGTYGIQDGLYVPAEDLFNAAFENKWSDAHTNFNKSLEKVSELVKKTLQNSGKVWIAEAGQSDFTAALIKNIKLNQPEIDTKENIFVVQHSNWNENMTLEENLNYVKSNCTYIKIPDGNKIGNGSPGLKSSDPIALNKYIFNQEIIKVWNLALTTADKFNGKEDRYLNEAIANGGLDFSDVSETCWIFGYENIIDIEQFFKEFSSSTEKK
ncbi:MAG: hypothetical protein H6609_11855 [Ignavibacteriales bacterium]|nr:hypothetical protein [Ignavibacteriales bacterium]